MLEHCLTLSTSHASGRVIAPYPIYSVSMSTRTQLTRRQAIVAGASFCSVGAFVAQRARDAHAFVTEEVAPGIHIRRGIDEDVTAQNEDAIANIGFIVGRDAVAVIDPGGSLTDGERLRAAIRQTTQLPIK